MQQYLLLSVLPLERGGRQTVPGPSWQQWLLRLTTHKQLHSTFLTGHHKASNGAMKLCQIPRESDMIT